MAHQFAKIAFTSNVRQLQRQYGSREAYAPMDTGEDHHHFMDEREAEFIKRRDSFYMATVSETGWPYLQYRGGPAGFVKVLDEQTLGFANYTGNRQYVSTGNLLSNDRIAIFFMDYVQRRRLKMLGRVQVMDAGDSEVNSLLADGEYPASIEQMLLIHIEAFDWNCPQHITPRYTTTELTGLQAAKSASPKPRQDNPAISALGSGPLELEISGIRQLTPEVRGYELRRSDRAELPCIEAGAHLKLPVRLADRSLTERHYSIASEPGRRDRWEIAVLRENQGAGGSLAVHGSWQIGTRLNVDLPENHFPLHGDQRPAILIAGGIGITPIKAMAHTLDQRGVSYVLHYAGRSYDQMAYRDDLRSLAESRLRVYCSNGGDRMNPAALLEAASPESTIYVCGPGRLIAAVRAAAHRLKIDPQRICSESFV